MAKKFLKILKYEVYEYQGVIAITQVSWQSTEPFNSYEFQKT